MYLKYYVLIILLYLYCYFESYHCETITVINFQRPVVTYFSKKHMKSWRLTTRRYKRQDPKYYINLYAETLVPIDHLVQVDLYIYELVGNRYQTTFFELHVKLCEFVESRHFGATLMKALNYKKCPFPPGNFSIENVTMSELPFALPFKQGRVYVNSSRLTNGVNVRLTSAYADMEIKKITVNHN